MRHSYSIASHAPAGWTPSHLPDVYVDQAPWLLTIPGLDYHGDIRPAGAAPSGFVSFQSRPDSGLCVSLADVCSRTKASEPVAGRAESLLQALSAYEPRRPEAVVEAVNRAIYGINADDAFLMLFHAWIDPDRRELRYVNAGHEPALLLRKHRERVATLEHTGNVLGLTANAAYGQRSIALEPGDLLVIYTAGLAESSNLDGNVFGSRGVLDAVREMASASAAAVASHVLDEAERHAGWPMRTADHGVAVVRYLGERERPILAESQAEEPERERALAAA